METSLTTDSTTARRQPVARLAYSVPEAAQALGVSCRTAWALVASGRLDTVRIGRRRLVPLSALAAFINADICPPHSQETPHV